MAADRLLTELRTAEDPSAVVTVLAQARFDVAPASLGRTLSTAAAVADTLRDADWQVLDRLRGLQRPGAAEQRETLRTGAATGEDAAPLGRVLAGVRTGVLDLLAADDEADRAPNAAPGGGPCPRTSAPGSPRTWSSGTGPPSR